MPIKTAAPPRVSDAQLRAALQSGEWKMPEGAQVVTTLQSGQQIVSAPYRARRPSADRQRGTSRPAAKPRHARRSTSSSTASDPPDAAEPPAALAAPKLPRNVLPADNHPPAALYSFAAGADAPRPDRPIPSVRASAGVLFHSNGDSFALDTYEIEGGFVRIKGRHRRVTGAHGSEIVRFGPDVNRVFPAGKILKIVEGDQ